jgi:hypothetical protein
MKAKRQPIMTGAFDDFNNSFDNPTMVVLSLNCILNLFFADQLKREMK